MLLIIRPTKSIIILSYSNGEIKAPQSNTDSMNLFEVPLSPFLVGFLAPGWKRGSLLNLNEYILYSWEYLFLLS